MFSVLGTPTSAVVLSSTAVATVGLGSSALGFPSPSQSSVPSGVPPTESQESLGSVPSKASCPSDIPSPSVSATLGSVVSPLGSAGVLGSSTPVVSSSLVSPSLSQSAVPSGVPPTELQESLGSVPSKASWPSEIPSPSVSALLGSVVSPLGSAGVLGSSTPVDSSSLVRPSLSSSQEPPVTAPSAALVLLWPFPALFGIPVAASTAPES
ncbi:Hypothetical protein I595_3422 [Croceitalea dokdonensis DOKDO 023]|uniref:Uncharacterized protein n=1 Tax=Croceitalea dokdonensis DOKDO 023 TaxID=1300341 RepID=A0A0P7ARR1_9FLAO|nr:Hypothetical protein I595_3422 [Croceitalea dokdonensis DOKDO 023]